MKQLNFEIGNRFLRNFKRTFTLDEDYLEFKNNVVIKESTRFKATDIVAYRYGINWISYILNFGREYIIEVQDRTGKILKVSLSSYFGINLKNKTHDHAKMVDSLWDFYFEKIIVEHLNQFKAGNSIIIGEVKIENTGIFIRLDNGFSRKETFIEWHLVETKRYRTYYSIFSSANPSQINRGYSFKNDWNTAVLYSVVEQILQDKLMTTN